MKCPPIILTSAVDPGRKLTRIEARPGGDTSEDWLQKLLYRHPDLLPVEDFDPTFGPPVAVARELPTPRGPIDLLFVSPTGGLTIIETKLFKNPEKHRVVVAQVIDYAKEVGTWDYDQFSQAVVMASRAQGETENLGLEDKLSPCLRANGIDLHGFQEAVAMNLESGRFLLLIVGDRVSPNIALMTQAIQSAPGLHFTVGLVELKLYSESAEQPWPLVVVPDIVGRTVEKTRGVVRVQYTKDKPLVTVSMDEGGDERGGLDIVLEKLPKDLRPVYREAVERWTALGGTVTNTNQYLYYSMRLAGATRTLINVTLQGVTILRRSDLNDWSIDLALYDGYLASLESSPVAYQVARAGKMWVWHDRLTAKDLKVIFDAANQLMGDVRRTDQG